MRLVVVLAMCAIAVSSAVADVVHLKGGGRVVGRVEKDGGKVRVVMAGGTLTLDPDRIERIEKQETPEQELDRRGGELARGDAAGALALARLAHESGLASREGPLLELAASWAQEDEEIRAALARWRASCPALPSRAAAGALLVAALGKEAKLHATPHWRVAYDTDLPFARRRAEMLEAAWRKFHDLVARLDLNVRPLDDALECCVFRDHDEWLAAIGCDDPDVASLVGLYAWKTRRILLYDTRTSPAAKAAERAATVEIAALGEARAAIEKQRADVALIETALADGAAAKRKDDAHLAELRAWLEGARTRLAKNEEDVDAREKELQRWRDDVARHFEDENVASTTHEACHQLAFAFGVSRPGQPKWLVEGLATLFEAQRRTSFVLEAPNEPRLADVRAAWARGEGGSLERLVADQTFAAPGRGSVAYAESWSLAYFLVNRRARDFAKFLVEGALLPDAPETAARRVADFRRFFGDDLAALEREWRSYVERL